MRFAFAACLLLFSAPAAAQQWWAAETDHFIVKSQDSEKDTRAFAEKLERFDAAMRSLQNLPKEAEGSPSTKLTVYRFGDTDDIARMADAPGSGIAGFYIAQAGDSVAYAPVRERRNRGSRSVTAPDSRYWDETSLDAESVLKHEYVHYFMMQHFPAAYPRWYVEGYAELLATLRLNDDGSFFVGDPPVYRSYEVLNMSQLRLSEMLDSDHKLSGRDAYMHYATGWLLSHYLNFNPTRLAQLNQYLTALGQGEDSLTTAQRIFGDLEALDRELRSYRRGPFPGLEVKPGPDYAAPEVSLRKLSEAEQAVISIEMRLRRGTDLQEAVSLLASARRAAAAYPDDFAAQSVVARAALSAKQFTEADALGSKLIEIDPQSAFGWIVRGEAAAGLIETDPTQAAAARRFAIEAAKLDPGDPRGPLSYYYSYVEAKLEVPEPAIIALESVFESAGSDIVYRLLLARQLLSESRTDSARTVLLPIAFRGHNQADEEEEKDPTLDKVMRLVEAGDAPAAVTMIDELIDFWEKERDEG